MNAGRALAAAMLGALAAAASEPPNILVILTDDQGYSDVSFYGRADVRTPNIDRLAKEGMTFTDMRSNCTVCSPSRAAILTGRYPDRAGVPGMSELRAKNVALVEHLDAGIGRVLASLDETGLAARTLVFFASDNGGSLPHGQCNDPWRDGKQSHYDGGLRVPFAVRWPGAVRAGSRSAYAGQSFDLFPTCLEAAGAPPLAGIDALSLTPVLTGDAAAGGRELYFVRREGGAKYGGKSYEALVRGDWKLLQNDPYSPLELYNVRDDPQETRNVAAAQPKVFAELSAALREHIRNGGCVPWQAPDKGN